jgi:hypothetical protein
MPMDVPLTAFVFASAALAASLMQRWRMRKKDGNDTARYVEAERIVSMLSARQPGVWDQEDLRERVQAIAKDVWSLPTLEALGQLQSWVNPHLLEQVKRAWPGRGERREVDVRFTAPVSFVQVNEGGPGPDRLIARLTAGWEGAWLDAQGRPVKKERRAPHATYHTWIHIDGQGWQLDAIADRPPTGEPPPSSVTCRILPQEAATRDSQTREP